MVTTQTKEAAYYKAVRQAVTAVSSDTSTHEKLNVVVRAAARCFEAGAAVLLLDDGRLVYAASSRLPPFYLRKGTLEAQHSLRELSDGQTVFIPDVTKDDRIQFPDEARKAGIVAIIGMPVACSEQPGSLRIYFKRPVKLTAQDLSFIRTMANLVGAALCCGERSIPVATPGMLAPEGFKASASAPPTFVHPSEEEFARILSYYGIEWVYEPRSFPLVDKAGGADEMFTPDFYLPGLDQYIELTTMKQSLATGKNRKLRKLKELYPGIRISLLYKKDYDRLLAKYGVGPLADSRAHGLRRVLFTASDIEKRVHELAAELSRDYSGRRPVLIGVQRGFLCFMADLIRQMNVPLDLDFMAISYYGGQQGGGVRVTKDIDLDITGRQVLLVEDIVDTGITLNYLLHYLNSKSPASLAVCTLLDRRARRLVDVNLAYVGFQLPDEFVVGYGLDYHEEYRNLPFIAVPELTEFPEGPQSA